MFNSNKIKMHYSRDSSFQQLCVTETNEDFRTPMPFTTLS